MSINLINYNNVIFIEKSIKNTTFKVFFKTKLIASANYFYKPLLFNLEFYALL